MNYRSKKFVFLTTKTKSKGFSLVELTAAVVVLGIICTGALIIINNSMEKGSDLMWRMKAFGVARENMERLLAKDSISSETDQGFDETYPDITWETRVDTMMRGEIMWVEAVSKAGYIDSSGEEQTVELFHWLTSVSKKMMEQIIKQQAEEDSWLENQRDYNPDYDPDQNPDTDSDEKPETTSQYPLCEDRSKDLRDYLKCLEEKYGIKL